MNDLQQRLASIGYAESGSDPVCWRAARVKAPAASGRPPERAPDPSSSPGLRYWRYLLAREPISPAYRITRIAS
jgi:hypothetical protein